MDNLNINTVAISDDTNDVTIYNPIEFMSKEDNHKLLQTVKERLKVPLDSEQWLSLEEFKVLAKETFNL